VELIGQADVLDWRGVSMVWGLTGFLMLPGTTNAVRFANAHRTTPPASWRGPRLIDDETVAKMGHPDGFSDVQPWQALAARGSMVGGLTGF
jgi:hypothetical protein